jgi:hydroxyacylglutathione hydrolase
VPQRTYFEDDAMAASVHTFRCASDNLGALLHDPATGATAAIDTCDAAVYEAALADKGWRLSDILITHEHHDHVEGVAALKARYGCRVIGSTQAAAAAPVDLVVGDGDAVSIGSLAARVFAAPGHSPGHVIYHFAGESVAFVGDVLFVMGCGRVFGEAYEPMWRSLGVVAGLPDATRLYTGHDYTIANGRFALHVEAGNAQLQEAEALAAKGVFNAVTTLAEERATNPFLRAGLPELAQAAGLPGAGANAVFRKLREMKNSFRG